jgi:probable HAF family extracellular repeat protein
VKTLCSLMLFGATAFGNPIYTITSLGGLGGSTSSTTTTGYAVNSSGAVAGWGLNSSGGQQAFVSASGGLTGLPLGSGTESYAYGINDAGTVVGNTYIGGQSHATIWSGSGATVLGANTYATAINGSGEVTGSNGQAFVVVDGQVQSLATMSGVEWSSAYGINNAGEVVGDGELANGTFRGLIWTPDGSVVLLGTPGGSSSQANDVNSSGEVVGFASLPSGYQHAFSMVDDMMIDLGTLGESSYAYGINDSGEIVGYSYLTDGDQHAFLYDDGSMLDLNSLLPPNSGWVLEEAFGINDSGQITGMGLYDGQQTAFLMTDPPGGVGDVAAVPEPSAVLVIAAGIGLMMIMLRARWASGLGDLGLDWGWGRAAAANDSVVVVEAGGETRAGEPRRAS